MPHPLTWTSATTPAELHPLLRSLAEEYPVQETAAAATLRFIHEPDRAGHRLEAVGEVTTVRYGRVSQAGRALGTLLAGLVPAGGTVVDQPASALLGLLLDCGHNATVTTAHLRGWLRRMALLGFDTLLVYTEAGYLLPDEPCFGYLRGAYSHEEMRELDAYAAGLGIELIGSIQTLGHLEQMLNWPPYHRLRDTEHTLLVGDPGVAALVDKMIEFWATALGSRRLHVGLDETYDLGRGRALDQHGYRPGLEWYADHLRLVADTCTRHGVRPMVWSDVLFRLAGASSAHYDPASRLPEHVSAKLPRDLDLVYWDYYRDDPQHYLDRLDQHRAWGFEPVMASAVWSWPTPWHDWRRTEAFAGACVSACRTAGVRELLFALWSDDGGYWDFDSSLAGVALVAELAHGDGTVDDAALARRFAAVTGSDLAVHRLASRLNDRLPTCSVLWDDPLLAMYLRHVAKSGPAELPAAAAHYREVAAALEPHRADQAAGDLGHAWLLARFLAAKTDLAGRLFTAYADRDGEALATVREAALRQADLTDELTASFRRRWMACCQPLGWEVLQLRLAGQAARYRELATRLDELLSGQVTAISELDESLKGAYLPARSNTFRGLASGARVF